MHLCSAIVLMVSFFVVCDIGLGRVPKADADSYGLMGFQTAVVVVLFAHVFAVIIVLFASFAFCCLQPQVRRCAGLHIKYMRKRNTLCELNALSNEKETASVEEVAAKTFQEPVLR